MKTAISSCFRRAECCDAGGFRYAECCGDRRLDAKEHGRCMMTQPYAWRSNASSLRMMNGCNPVHGRIAQQQRLEVIPG